MPRRGEQPDLFDHRVRIAENLGACAQVDVADPRVVKEPAFVLGPLLRAIDAAAAADDAIAAQLDRALVAPRRLLERLVAGAPHPPPNPREFALLLMATHRAYLLDIFGAGQATPRRRREATEALTALWQRLLTP